MSVESATRRAPACVAPKSRENTADTFVDLDHPPANHAATRAAKAPNTNIAENFEQRPTSRTPRKFTIIAVNVTTTATSQRRIGPSPGCEASAAEANAGTKNVR